jgi:hypothetical protein
MSTFRVMTFNVNGSTYGEGPHSWEQRAMLNVQTIMRLGVTQLRVSEPVLPKSGSVATGTAGGQNE